MSVYFRVTKFWNFRLGSTDLRTYLSEYACLSHNDIHPPRLSPTQFRIAPTQIVCDATV